MHTKDNEVAKVYGLVFCIVAFFVFLGVVLFFGMKKTPQHEPSYQNSEINQFLTTIQKPRLDFYGIDYISVENFSDEDRITYIIDDKRNTFYQHHSNYFHNFVGDKYKDATLTYPLNDSLIISNNDEDVILMSSSPMESMKTIIFSMHLADAIINAIATDLDK